MKILKKALATFVVLMAVIGTVSTVNYAVSYKTRLDLADREMEVVCYKDYYNPERVKRTYVVLRDVENGSLVGGFDFEYRRGIVRRGNVLTVTDDRLQLIRRDGDK